MSCPCIKNVWSTVPFAEPAATSLIVDATLDSNNSSLAHTNKGVFRSDHEDKRFPFPNKSGRSCIGTLHSCIDKRRISTWYKISKRRS